MLAMSLGLTALAIFTAFMFVPPLILLPLACIFGYKAFQQSRRENARLSPARTVLALVPVVLPAALFFFFLWAINTQYKA